MDVGIGPRGLGGPARRESRSIMLPGRPSRLAARDGLRSDQQGGGGGGDGSGMKGRGTVSDGRPAPKTDNHSTVWEVRTTGAAWRV